METYAKKVLLLVEDNPLLTGLYKSAFEKEGFKVLVAHEGKQGLELAKEQKPAMILLDFLMVGMNGLQVLEELRKDPSTKDTKVIMLTVSNDPEHKEKAKQLGAADYLIKSDLRVNDIVAKVKSHLA